MTVRKTTIASTISGSTTSRMHLARAASGAMSAWVPGRTSCSMRGRLNGSVRRSSMPPSRASLPLGTCRPFQRSTGMNHSWCARLTQTARGQTWARLARTCSGTPSSTGRLSQRVRPATTRKPRSALARLSPRSTTTTRPPSSRITFRSRAPLGLGLQLSS